MNGSPSSPFQKIWTLEAWNAQAQELRKKQEPIEQKGKTWVAYPLEHEAVQVGIGDKIQAYRVSSHSLSSRAAGTIRYPVPIVRDGTGYTCIPDYNRDEIEIAPVPRELFTGEGGRLDFRRSNVRLNVCDDLGVPPEVPSGGSGSTDSG